MPTVNVVIPANAEFVHVLRSVVGSIGALADASIDAIDDLRLAVDEACAHLLASAADATRLWLTVRSGSGDIDVLAQLDAEPAAWPPADVAESLGWRILSGLVQEPRFERTDGRVGIGFSKRLGPAA